MNISRPEDKEYPEYFKQYISLIKPTVNVIKELESQVITMQSFLGEVPEGKENYAYAPGKWSIKEVIGHIIDTERIMGYRALRFARNDKTELPGFEENDYVKQAGFNKRNIFDLAHEFAVVRESNLTLFKNLDDKALSHTGIANGKSVSVRALVYIIAGHSLHHLNVIRKKYLIDLELTA